MEAKYPELQHHNLTRSRLDEYATRRFQQAGGEGRDNIDKPCHDTDMLLAQRDITSKSSSRVAMRPQRSRQDPCTNDAATP